MADDWHRLIQGLRDGDQSVISDFHARHGVALRAIADQRLSPMMKRRIGASDVVQSAFRTFFRRAGEGRFQFSDSESLWSLLCAITLTKVREQVRYHRRDKRDVGREASLADASRDGTGFDLISGRELAPEMAVALADQFEQLVGALDEEEREVLSLKIDDRTDEEIAESIGSSERTVQRIVRRLRAQLEDQLSADS